MTTTKGTLWDAMSSTMDAGRDYTIGEIYEMVSQKIILDGEDQLDNGFNEPAWRRNIRNVLQTRKVAGDLEWLERGTYRLGPHQIWGETTAAKLERICVLVGIAPIAPLKGSTEPAEFFASVADALGVQRRRVDGTAMTKREIAEAVTTAAGLDWDPLWDGRDTPSGGGGSISNRGLDEIDAAARVLLAGQAVLPDIATLARLEGGGASLAIVEPRMIQSERLARLQAGAFRVAVLAAYEGRCAVTGTSWEYTLEAAHIDPYSTSLDNRLSNGIALRADVHSLFDKHVLLIEPDGLTVRFQPDKQPPGEYAALEGGRIRTPADPSAQPSPDALARIWGLYWRG